MRMFAGRNKIMAGSLLLFLLGTMSFLASSSSVGIMDGFLSILSNRYTTSASLLFWDTPEPPLPTEPVEVCFISSIYAKTAAMADTPGDFKDFELIKPSPPNTFHFFLSSLHYTVSMGKVHGMEGPRAAMVQDHLLF
jgi:hypothetical protein